MPSPVPRRRRASWWRVIIGLIVGAGGASLGALLLGEYDFSGLLPWLGGPVLGVALAELVVVVGGQRSLIVGAAAGAFAAVSLLWAAWISSGEGLTAPSWGLGPGMALAALAAVLWTGVDRRRETSVAIRLRRRPGDRSL